MGYVWLGPALRLQTAVAASIMAFVCFISLAGWRFGAGSQLAVLLGGIILTGFPHGAFDHLVARPALEARLGRFWSASFLAGYFALAGLVWFGWLTMPALTLVAFLIASIVHFGLGDVEDGLAPSSIPRTVAVLSYGGLPLLLPMALHPAEAAPVLAALAGVSDPVMENALHGTLWLLPVWAAAFVWVMVAAWRERLGVAERLVTAASFVLLPPLLAFGLYFSVGHAVRHMLRLGAWYSPNDFHVAARWLARTALPFSLLCFAALGAAVLAGWDTTVGLLTPGFRVIAALTLPHMIVTLGLSNPASRSCKQVSGGS